MTTIYLDHNATSFPWPEVVDTMTAAWREPHANASSQHRLGRQARRVLDDAREELARMLGADASRFRPDRVVFTSGATEANNLAMLGLTRFERGRVVISAVEHPSVSEAATILAGRGFEIVRLPVDAEGRSDPDALDELLDTPTQLVSVMLANHETGVLQPIAELAAVCRAHNVPLHTDATQAAGKLPIRFAELGVAALTISAHKFQGPPGVGALIVKPEWELRPLIVGGFQQQGLRSGTESIPPILGMLAALRKWEAERDVLAPRLAERRDQLEAALRAGRPGIVIHGASAPRLPQVTNISFLGLDRRALMIACDLAGVACSTGSACASGSSEPSPTLRAMQVPFEQVASALRFSVGPLTSPLDITLAAERILLCCNQLEKSSGSGKFVGEGP